MLMEKDLKPNAVPMTIPVLLMACLLAGAVWPLPADRYDPEVQVTEKSFSRLALTDLLWTEDVLLEVRAMSRVDCSHKCVATQGCVLLTFHPSPPGPPHPCRLYTTLHQDTQHGTNATGAVSFAMEVPAPAVVNPSTSGDWLIESDNSCSPDTGSCQTTGTPEGSDTTLSSSCNASSCTGGYSLQCGRCLLVGPVKDLVTYSMAKGRCSSRGGGRLVMPKNLTDLLCVWNFSQGTPNPWVGADNIQVVGQYTWNDGTLLPTNSPMWAVNPSPVPTNIPFCVYMYAPRLSVYQCSGNTLYVCQIDCS